MSANRGQGRPPKGDTQVGRDHLVQVAKRLLAAGDGKLISRTELAEAAHVTPSLVNYYFRDQGSLIEAVAAPAIARSIADLKRILRERSGPDRQLEQLIRLFLAFNRDYATYLDGFLSVCAGDASKDVHTGAIIEALGDLVCFFEAGMRERHWRPLNATFVVFALFGMCKFVAQTPILPVAMFDEGLDKQEVIERQVALVLDLLSRGLMAQSWSSSPPASSKLDGNDCTVPTGTGASIDR